VKRHWVIVAITSMALIGAGILVRTERNYCSMGEVGGSGTASGLSREIRSLSSNWARCSGWVTERTGKNAFSRNGFEQGLNAADQAYRSCSLCRQYASSQMCSGMVESPWHVCTPHGTGGLLQKGEENCYGYFQLMRGTTMQVDYPWEELYEDAVLETDDEKLAKRLQVAKAAIDARLQVLHVDHQGMPEERQAIRAALTGLDVLRRDRNTLSRSGFEQGLNAPDQVAR